MHVRNVVALKVASSLDGEKESEIESYHCKAWKEDKGTENVRDHNSTTSNPKP